MAQVLGAFEQAVLLALVRPATSLGKEAYGRAILKEVQARLQRQVSAGSVYATLERLETKGLVSSRLGPGTDMRAGRPRRYYQIEAAGLRALSEARATVERIWAGVRLPVRGAAS
jgi:PadR family transcriptional regulator PadR